MKSITDVDKNFKVETNIQRDGLKFFNAEEEPFKIYGVFREGDRFRRMPEAVAKTVSPGVEFLHTNTAGGRIRFITDSPYVAINVKLDKSEVMNHFSYTGSTGFDLYVKEDEGERYTGSFRPSPVPTKEYESILEFENKKLREITINMPLYSDVLELYIGLDENSVIEAPKPYKTEKSVVFYGSSITQGGCASRPGMAYEAIISRALDCDYINLGFSGSAKGEQEMADYLKTLDMDLFVMDYDANAGTPEYLDATHNKMFETIRKAQPDLPILMLSYPKYYLMECLAKRRDIIKRNYENAKAAGDKNVYFIPGNELMSDEIGADGTVDNCHPTDLGFFSMAQKIIPVLKDILK